MKPSPASIRRFLHLIAFFIFLLGGVAWTATAVSFHLTGALLVAIWVLLGVAAVGIAIVAVKARAKAWLMLVLFAAITMGWYQTIMPSEDRDWAFDLAHGVKARVDGDAVVLRDVRNFQWETPKAAVQSWEERTYDLKQLASVDMVTSVWDSPDIAHLLVSFGFADGQRVAFSVETRRESHEEFSTIGGFFRMFELILIAATEEDIVKLRTNYRQEDVRLYPLNLNEEQRRKLFMSYVGLANRLEQRPAFYNTLTRNCTTTVYPLASSIAPDIGLDWRVLMSGNLPSYIDQLGGFADELPLDQREERAKITDLGLASDGADYSEAIRAAYRTK